MASPDAHPHAPATVADVLARLLRDPGRPRLTWYGPDGERVELSGHVLDNWVAKTTNLLVEELDAGPGTVVLLDLPVHWRTVVWALATWRAGATVLLDPGAPSSSPRRPDVVVTDAPDRHPDAAELVAVALPALARRFDGDLPTRALDAATAVMTYGDVISWAPAVDRDEPALGAADPLVPHGALVGWATACPAAARSAAPAPRALLAPPVGGRVTDAVRDVLGVLALDGSVVLCDPAVGAELAVDGERRERLVSAERVTSEG
ncbi:TIGR03089 family protein [Actinotalea sp. JY-7876]|uniref:TIGR03089 family protein n=1 Tax=Actinotalea sp. JY-7876 TaxID=2758442 RepID=UPI0015F4B165|nr:TIGR03089 family protein [Actinotalea sp. JY-7876]